MGDLHPDGRPAIEGGERTLLLTAAGSMSAAALRERVARVHAALPQPKKGSQIAFAFDADRPGFLAALLATWAKGHAAALPADPRRASVAPVIELPSVALLAHDTGVGLGLDVRKLLAAAPMANLPELAEVPFAGALTTYGLDRHGGLGSRSWNVRGLVDEVVARLRLPAGAIVWNAFRPACPHALVPGLLAPLRAGCSIAGAPGIDAATLAAVLDRGLEGTAVHTLVGPAALLRALARQPQLARLAQVVAPDEPLEAATLRRFTEAGTRVVGGYGSTAAAAPDPREIELLHAALAIDGIADAAVAVTAGAPGPQFFCAVAPEPAAEHLRSELRSAVADHTTLLGVPHLGRDADGQIARDVLLRMFGRGIDGELPSTRLLWSTTSRSGDRAQFRTLVPADFFAFDGHFPGYPVLSGAVQLHELVLPCVRAALGRECTATAFLDLKFLARIAPGDSVGVALRWSEPRTHVDFEITRDATRCSAGRVLLQGSTPEPAP